VTSQSARRLSLCSPNQLLLPGIGLYPPTWMRYVVGRAHELDPGGQPNSIVVATFLNGRRKALRLNRPPVPCQSPTGAL
jgi:hypothetical protein